jgi:hypothetical protein
MNDIRHDLSRGFTHRPCSYGLLYSVASIHFSALLHEESRRDEINWQEYEAQGKGASLVGLAINFLKATATRLGIIKLQLKQTE